MENVSFKQKEIPNRGVTEVLIEVTVAGEYSSIVKFLNGLQRSSNNLYCCGRPRPRQRSFSSGSGAERGHHQSRYASEDLLSGRLNEK